MPSKKAKRSLDEVPIHHLLPYLITVIASFVWFVPYEPTPARAILKCLPILYLIIYLGITERGRGESSKVLPALVFSIIGDAFLAFPQSWFLQGLQAFAVAQILYTISFGFKRRRLPVGISLYGSFSLLMYFILPNVPTELRRPIPIYATLIVTMFWRALDRYSLGTHLCVERRLFSALGAITFITSDLCIVFLQLMKLIPHFPAQFIILTTYYLAQLLLTLGSAENFWANKRVFLKKQ